MFRYPSARNYIEIYHAYFGLLRKAFRVVRSAGQDALTRYLEKLLGRRNTSGDGTLVVQSDYLEVVATRK